MAVEADSPVGVDGAGGGLGDVVEEGGEAEFERRVGREHFKHDAGVDIDVALGMPLGRLVAADQGQDFGEEMGDESGIDQ